jgi:hypothetical protein
MALGSTQPLTEMSTRNLPGGKGRPARKAKNLTATCEPIVWKIGSHDVLQLCGPTGTAVLFFVPFAVSAVHVCMYCILQPPALNLATSELN